MGTCEATSKHAFDFCARNHKIVVSDVSFSKSESLDLRRKNSLIKALRAAAQAEIRGAHAHRKNISRWKVVRGLALLLASPRRISDVLSFLKAKNTSALINHKPELILKWSDKYLGKTIAVSHRCRMFAFHYLFIGNCIKSDFYDRLLSGGFDFWSSNTTPTEVTIHLRLPRSPREGDLSLVMALDGIEIYELSFTIVPGETMKVSCPVLLIARLQGRRQHYEAIKKATKLCRDVAPAYVLTAAVEGIARALKVECVAGVDDTDQLGSRKLFDYSSFWNSLAFRKAGGQYYISALPIYSRPLEECAADHRRRTKRKRQFKADIRLAVEDSFVLQCLVCTESHEFSFDKLSAASLTIDAATGTIAG